MSFQTLNSCLAQSLCNQCGKLYHCGNQPTTISPLYSIHFRGLRKMYRKTFRNGCEHGPLVR